MSLLKIINFFCFKCLDECNNKFYWLTGTIFVSVNSVFVCSSLLTLSWHLYQSWTFLRNIKCTVTIIIFWLTTNNSVLAITQTVTLCATKIFYFLFVRLLIYFPFGINEKCATMCHNVTNCFCTFGLQNHFVAGYICVIKSYICIWRHKSKVPLDAISELWPSSTAIPKWCLRRNSCFVVLESWNSVLVYFRY